MRFARSLVTIRLSEQQAEQVSIDQAYEQANEIELHKKDWCTA